MLGVLPSNTTMGTDESADGLVVINALLDSWRNDGTLCYANREESLTLSASTVSYTIGPSGTLNTTRPVEILQAWIVDGSNQSHNVRLINDDEYAAIPDKTLVSDWPDRANYKPSMSTGTLYVYPLPNATRTMKLLTRVPVTAFSATTDTVTLPPGWEEALASNTAIGLAPEYQVAVPAEVAKMARDSLRLIKRINARPVRASTELGALLGSGSSSNIQTGP